MKIGLLGNMNNNNFALLRYFHDLGVDADLLLMSDDNIDILKHFSPENDTWDIARWKPYIKRLPVPNQLVSAIGADFPWNIIFWIRYIILCICGSTIAICFKPPPLKKIRKSLEPYDYLVGSGITPALLYNVDRKLDIFYPYSSGIEWVDALDMVALEKNSSWIKRAGAKYTRNKQIAGIKAAKHVVSVDEGYTAQAFKEMAVSYHQMKCPMIYRERPPKVYPPDLTVLLESLSPYDLRFISHTRHHWVNKGDLDQAEWELKHSKHNNWIIHAYAEFRRQHPKVKSTLVLMEYGFDVSHSKELCQELGVEDAVIWFECTSRKYLLEIISACDVGIAQFYSTPQMTWGGTALEIMACGKPLVQGFMFDKGEFQNIYDIPPPPLCAVRNQDDLTNWLLRLGENPSLRTQLGHGVKDWFYAYNGRGLAQKWLDLITS